MLQVQCSISNLLYHSSIVEFNLRDDMEYALKKLNDRELNGQRVSLREVSKKHLSIRTFLLTSFVFNRAVAAAAVLAVVLVLVPSLAAAALLVAVDVLFLNLAAAVLLVVEDVHLVVLALLQDLDPLLARERDVILLVKKSPVQDLDLAALPSLPLPLALNPLLLAAKEGKV